MLGEYDSGYENYIDSLIREIEKLQDENDKLSEQVSSLVGRSFRTADKMSCIEADNAKLREYVTKLEAANLDVTARLTDYIGQYDPTDAFVAEVKADNAKLRELVRDMWLHSYCSIAKTRKDDERHVEDVMKRMRELGVEVDA